MLEMIVHNQWIRWSYFAAVLALNLLIITPLTYPTDQQLVHVLRAEVRSQRLELLARVKNDRIYRRLVNDCSGDRIDRCVNDEIFGKYDFVELPHWRSIHYQIHSHLYIRCDARLFIARCTTEDVGMRGPNNQKVTTQIYY